MTNPEGDFISLLSRMESFILDNQDYFYGFALPIIFPPYALWSFSSDALSVVNPKIKGSSSKQKAGSATSMATVFAYDVYSVNRGLASTSAARWAATNMAADLIKTRTAISAVPKAVPLIPMGYGALAAATYHVGKEIATMSSDDPRYPWFHDMGLNLDLRFHS